MTAWKVCVLLWRRLLRGCFPCCVPIEKKVIVLVVMALCILAAVVWLSLTPGSKALVQEDPAQVESVAFARYGSDGYQEVTRYDDPEAV